MVPRRVAAWAEAGKVKIDRWLEDVAPSAELRRWFGHASERWGEFDRGRPNDDDKGEGQCNLTAHKRAQGPETFRRTPPVG